MIADLDGIQQDLSHVKRSNDDGKYWQNDQNNPAIDPMLYDNDSSIDNEPNVGNTVIDDDDKYGVICDRNNDDNPPPLPPESSDDNGLNLERYQSNDNNNNFNYDDIDKEILHLGCKNSIGESETIFFRDCDNNLDAT